MLSVESLQKWDKSIESAELARDKHNTARRDNRQLKASGIKKYTYTTEIPNWFKNINSTFKLKATIETNRWSEWLRNQTKLPDPKPMGRPRVEEHLKKKQIRIPKREKHKQLLLDHGISLTKGNPSYVDVYLVEYPKIRFMTNGKLELEDKTRISVINFLKNVLPLLK